MKNRTRISFFVATIVLSLLMTSCSMWSYVSTVENKQPLEEQYKEFNSAGKKYLVVLAYEPDSPIDSVLMSNAAIGMAERVEEEFNLTSGSVPVVIVDFTTISDMASEIAMYKVRFDNDYLLLLDSLDMRFTVEANPKAVVGDRVLSEIIIPVAMRFQVWDANNYTSIYGARDTVKLQSEIFVKHETKLSDIITSFDMDFANTFKKIGSLMVGKLMPKWREENVTYYVTANSQWNKAYELASDFRLEEALEIWINLIDRSNDKNKAYLGYNIATTLMLLEKYDLSLQWIDISQKAYNFKELTTLKELVVKKRAGLR